MREIRAVSGRSYMDGSGVVRGNPDGRRVGMVVSARIYTIAYRGVIRGEGDVG